MSRLTGTDAYGLMEAYNNVYAPKELTEEQVWEEVETWVNSLVEEGYDLSDYTWEEMYESYLEEAPLPPLSPALQIAADAGKKAKDKRSVQDFFGIKQQKPTATATPAPTADRPSGGAPRPSGGAPRPSGGAPRPSGGATAKVSPTPTKPAGPAMGKLGGTTFERRTPTSAELKAAQAARASGASPEKALQAAKSAGGALQQTAAKVMEKPPAFSPTPAVAKTTPTPAAAPARPMGGARARMLGASFDPFDVIKGHLLDEGYADTEESALAIMANMSEEWRQSILSEDPVQDYRDMKRANQNAAGMRGPELSHSSKGPMSPGSATQKPQPRSREFSHGNQGGKPGPMKNPGPNFGRG
jgi:hypothetical protein